MQQSHPVRKHGIDFKGMIPFPWGAYYFGFYGGKDLRSNKEVPNTERRTQTRLVLLFWGTALILGTIFLALAALSIGLYATKSILGIDLLPSSPFQNLLENLHVCHRHK